MAPSVTDNPSGGAEDCEMDPNGTDGITVFGFTSEDEESDEGDLHGYVLLLQEPDTDDHPSTIDTFAVQSAPETTSAAQIRTGTADELEVSLRTATSTSSAIANGIDLDEERIDKIKAAMVGFTLPNSAIPPWASIVPEDQWKEYLLTTAGRQQHPESQAPDRQKERETAS